MKYITEGFNAFSQGIFENGGQNLYVSKKGILQRIFQYDLNQDGYPDLLFANSQSMYERAPIRLYKDLLNSKEVLELPAKSCGSAVLDDLMGSGYDDLVLACQHDGTHNDVTSIIYFGSAEGLSERYKQELPAPNATGVCAGDFNGDGKKELVFISNGKLRLFYQIGCGFGPADFIDYNLEASGIAVADLDGDGFCDLVFKNVKGNVGVIFGNENGLDTDNVYWLEIENSKELNVSCGSTDGMIDLGGEWKLSIVTINGKQYVFCVDGENAKFFTCGKERNLRLGFFIHCPGALAAVAADLTGNESDDLAIAVFHDRDEYDDCRIYLGNANGLDLNDYIKVPVKGAANVSVVNLNGNKLIICRGGERVEQEVASPVLKVSSKGRVEQVAEIVGGDSTMILAGYPAGKSGGMQVVVPSRTMNRKQGNENIYIYLGGVDGFSPDRRVELPGHSSVDGAMCDFFDTGRVDVLVTNCFEDAPHMDDGSYLYLNDGEKFEKSEIIKLPTVRGHGVAIADFNKDGYLDLIFGGYCNRELRIFYGSENGFSLENCSKIVLGSNEPDYEPWKLVEGPALIDQITEDEQRLIAEHGEVRWLLAADFNGDGWMDLFVSEITGPHCFIFWGGPEGFSKERMTTLLTDGVASATVADLNGNGYPDLILAQHMSSKKNVRFESYVTVYWGGPDGYQENRKMQLPTSCSNSVTVGDYNGNGQLDIYATSYNNGRCRDLLSFLYKNDNGNFSINNVQYLFNHSGCGCVSGDFNGDGYTDLAVACHKEHGNHMSHSFVFWGGPDGLSDERKTVLPTVGPHGMCTVDPGNIMNRGDKEHYTSTPLRLQDGSVVESISWEGECTSTSWVEVELRSAENEQGLECAQWHQVEPNVDISELNFTGVVQYRLALCAKCACGTPRISKITITVK